MGETLQAEAIRSGLRLVELHHEITHKNFPFPGVEAIARDLPGNEVSFST